MRRMLRVLVIALVTIALPLTLTAGAVQPTAVQTAGAVQPTAVQPAGRGAASVVDSSIVTAGVDDFSFASLNVEYTLGRDDDGASTVRVVETFVAVFPDIDQNRGMRRSIPDSYLGAPLDPQLVSITDGDGDPRASETDSEDGTFSMTSRADDYVRGAQTYVFTYTLRNVTRFFANTGADEFYWNVNGTDWPQQFGTVSARVVIPADLAGALTGEQACYVGYSGATDRCEIAADTAPDGASAARASTAPVQPYQTMTVSIGFARGTFTPFDSSYFASPWGWLQGVAGIGLIGSLILAFRSRSRWLRDGAGRPTIIAEYTPPRQVDALESAVLLGLTTKAIPAEVLEQAVVGSIRIVEGEAKRWSKAKLIAQLIDPSKADGDGMLLLKGLFPKLTPGAEYEFGSSDTRFSTAAQKILKLAEQELVSRGLRRPVDAKVRARPILLAMLAAAGAVVFGILALGASVQPAVPIVVIIAAVLVVILVSGLMSRKPLTAEGAEVRDHLEGLKEFIEWAEADRIRMLQSPQGAERVRIDPSRPQEMLKLYEVLLPYAVVFGQEKEWAEHLAVLYGPNGSPGWYSGSSGFSAASFSSGISTLSTSSSSSSSTGGSSGGGSAGGGGGGGGGGGV